MSVNSYGEREGIKGPVYSICQVTYAIDSINQNNDIIKGEIVATLTNACYKLDTLINIIGSYEINSSGGIQNKMEYAYEYDTKNRIVAKYFYTESWRIDKDSSRSSFRLYEKDNYQYNENNNLCCETRFEPDGRIFNRTIYMYNKKGNLIKRILKDSTDKVMNLEKIAYNRWRNRVVTKEYYPDNLYCKKTIERYFIDHKTTKVNNNKSNEKIKYVVQYDENGRGIKESLFTKKGKVDGYWLNQYNDNDELISQEYYNITADKLLELEINRKYIFKYDAYGNWITKLLYDQGKPSEITERQIEYR